MYDTGRQKQRWPGRAERRAMAWLSEQDRRRVHSPHIGSENPSQERGVTVAYRPVLETTEFGLFERPEITSFLAGYTGAATLSSLWTSLVNRSMTRQLASRGLVAGHLRAKFVEATKKMPEVISGEIGRAAIFGVQHNGPGWRFVSYTVDEETTNTLVEERSALLSAIGWQGTHYRSRQPHVSVFATRDPELAGQLKDQLNELRSFEIPIEFGRPEVEIVPQSYV